jgi:hypothetical protein
MKNVIIAGLILASTPAIADCYMRSNIKLTRQVINAGPTDIQRLVVNDGANKKCMVQYRVHIGDEWHTAEGVGQAKEEGPACAQAMDVGQGRVLNEVEPSKITSESDMVCNDLPEIRVRAVRIGEVIWESETDMHRHEQERQYFDYKQTRCRMFTERNAKDRNLYTYQGIICKADTNPLGKWRVIDKY